MKRNFKPKDLFPNDRPVVLAQSDKERLLPHISNSDYLSTYLREHQPSREDAIRMLTLVLNEGFAYRVGVRHRLVYYISKKDTQSLEKRIETLLNS